MKHQKIYPAFAEELTQLYTPLQKRLKAVPYRWKAAPRAVQKAIQSQKRLMRARLPNRFYSVCPRFEGAYFDVQAAYNGDPAALSYAEVKLSYPGLIAIASHRIAHELTAYKFHLFRVS